MLVVQSSNRSLVNQAFTKYDSLWFFELEVNKKKYEEWLDEYGNNLLSMNLQEDIDMEK